LSGQRHIAGLLIGGALLAAGAVIISAPTAAQTLRPAIRDDAAPLPPIRPRAAPRLAPQQPLAEDPPPPTVNRARQRAAVAASDTPVSEDAPAAALEEAELEPTPTGMRPAVRDGDLQSEGLPEAPPDGVIDEPDDYRNPDGADPVAWDARSPEDADPFEQPPAGFDAQAFGVELDPFTDRRPWRLFNLEPWAPRGVRVGSFTVFPSIDLGAAWLSNLFRTRPAQADRALEVRPTLRAVSNWRVHALELRATGGYTFLDEFPKEGDRAYTLEARGRLDVTRRTSVAASVQRDVAQESRGTLESRLRGGARADVTTDEARLTFDHRFNRLAVQLRGLAQERTYEDTQLAGGGLASNRDRNVTITEEAARLSWTFKPTFIAFAETAINQRRFEAAAADGIRRDSDGVRYRAGIGFGTSGNTLRGEASIGYGQQSPVDARLPAIDGVIIDANVAWRANALTAVLLTASSDVVETTTPLSPGGLTQRYQAEARHAFMRPLIGSAFAGYTATAYKGIGINESQTDLGLGVEYYLGRESVLYGRYQHSMFRTNAPTGDWDADEVRVGMRVRQ
jgi:hypothetical protein